MVDPGMALRGGRTAGGAPADLAIAGGVLGPDPAGGPALDLGGLVVSPGYLDLQINGGLGLDFTTDPETMWEVGASLPASGVTAFLPTLVSTDLEVVDAARRVVVAGPPHGYAGAAVLGLHVEGPFLARSRRGAHDPGKLRHPSPDLVGGWSPATGVRMVTLAPELPGGLATIAALAGNGVVVSLGHSDATFDQAMAGFDAGATMATHLFNAMSGMAHRSPGLAAATLAHPTVAAGLIADGHHVDAGAVRVARAALGPDRIVLVTDAVAPTGAISGLTPCFMTSGQ
ncbi:MAG: N-acetylglucosamine-6-phosphate deacetylase [Acidimicrobiia bacterium]